MAGFDAEFPLPTYSEIGILFCRADQEAQLRIPCIRSKAGAAAAQRLRPMERRQSPACKYMKVELLPELYTAGCGDDSRRRRLSFPPLRNGGDRLGGHIVPPLPGTYTGVEIRGSSARRGGHRFRGESGSGGRSSI